MAGRRANGEGSVYCRRDGTWAASAFFDLTDGQRKRVTVYGKTRREAHDKLADKLERARRGIRTPAKELTVAEFLDYWLALITTPRSDGTAKIKWKTAESYESIIRLYLKPGLGHIRLSVLRPADFQRLIHQREGAGTTPRRIHQCKQVLHSALNLALREERVVTNAAHGAELPDYHRKPVRIWTSGQLHHFISATSGHRWHVAFLISAIYGLRPGEVVGLQWQDIDFGGDVIHVRRQLQRVRHQGLQLTSLKTHAGLRDAPLTSEVRAALLPRRYSKADDDFVVTSSAGKPIDPKNYYREFLQAAKTAGLPRITLYRLRHGAATMMKDVGADPKDVQELLGHANITTTQQVYQQGNPEAKRRSLATISAAVIEGVATETATNVELSKGESTIIRVLTSGGSSGDRTRDTLLKRHTWSTEPDLPTSVTVHVLALTRRAILGRVATEIATNSAPTLSRGRSDETTRMLVVLAQNLDRQLHASGAARWASVLTPGTTDTHQGA